MLNMYQLWLDDLYPRAKFADGLAMIEKLGHTKRIQMMRKEWIDEGKPRHTTREEEECEVTTDEYIHKDTHDVEILEETAVQNMEQQSAPNGTNKTIVPLEEPDEDELDALLAVGLAPAPPSVSAGASVASVAVDDDDPFADAMDVLRDMDETW